MWKVIDKNGTIHSGTYYDMQTAFNVMTGKERGSKADREAYITAWEGDLELVEVHEISR